ncbi:MAG: hypothetical protein IJ121_08515 [Eubacterium sp.]|nr:hypothetical protein [Eubacterium sp.]
MNFYQSPYQNLDKTLPAEVDYFSPCYPDYDEGPCTLPISKRIGIVRSCLQQFSGAGLLSRAVQDATEKILKEWIVDEASMIQVYGVYLSRCVKEHPEAAFGSRFTAWGRETAARRRNAGIFAAGTADGTNRSCVVPDKVTGSV